MSNKRRDELKVIKLKSELNTKIVNPRVLDCKMDWFTSFRLIKTILIDPNRIDRYGYSLLHYDIDYLHVKLLIWRGADVNVKDSFGNTPLHYQKDIRSIKALIQAGADVYNINNSNKTLLHYYRNGKIIIALIDAMREKDREGLAKFVNRCDHFNETALHAQTYKDDRSIVALIGAGANVHVKNIWGNTPLDIASVKRVHRYFMIHHLQSFCKRNFRYFVFKRWITSREGVEWLYHPKRGGKYVQRRMYSQLKLLK